MDLSVHIINKGNNSQIIAAHLKDLGINVDFSHDDHYALYNTYHDLFGNFHHISTASVVVINGSITPNNTLEILYAILKNKPIISIGNTDCTDEVDNFTQKLIKKAKSHFLTKDISQVDEAELSRFLSEITKQPVDYHLESHQTALIRARVRAFFRETINPSIIA